MSPRCRGTSPTRSLEATPIHYGFLVDPWGFLVGSWWVHYGFLVDHYGSIRILNGRWFMGPPPCLASRWRRRLGLLGTPVGDVTLVGIFTK